MDWNDRLQEPIRDSLESSWKLFDANVHASFDDYSNSLVNLMTGIHCTLQGMCMVDKKSTRQAIFENLVDPNICQKLLARLC